ncbi:MAG: hypothetical protein AB7P52_11550 [Alphaproteobacteria bacterium]
MVSSIVISPGHIANLHGDIVSIDEIPIAAPPDLTEALAKALAASYGDEEGRDAFAGILERLNDGLAGWGEAVDRLHVAIVNAIAATSTFNDLFLAFENAKGDKLKELNESFGAFGETISKLDLEQLKAVRETIAALLRAAINWRNYETTRHPPGSSGASQSFDGFGAAGSDLLLGGTGSDTIDTAAGGTPAGLPRDAATVIEELNALTAELGFEWEETFGRMKEVLLDFAETGKFEWRDLARIALDAIEDMILGWLKLQQQQAGKGGDSPWSFLLDAAGSIIGGLFGGGSGGGTGITSVNGSGAGSGGPAAGQFLNFAEGGSPPVGVPSIVGEQGPELFVPRIAGEIVPNHVLAGAAGRGENGRPVVINLNVSPGVPEAVRREVAALMPQIAQAAKLGVAADMDRNGALRRRFS